MALRTGHGNGAGVPRVEVLPPDELPHAVPAESATPSVLLEFRRNGKIGDSATAKELGARGGRKRAERLRMIAFMAELVPGLPKDAPLAPYAVQAQEFREQHARALAQMAGDRCGTAPSTMVANAARQLMASRFLFAEGARTGDAATFKAASSLANDSRQNLMAAYELAVREATARSAQEDDAATLLQRQRAFQKSLASGGNR